jgi:N-acetylmuramoyl-L-alanine amidase
MDPRIKYVTRREWGARAPRETTSLPRSQAWGLAVHYSAGGNPGAHSNCDNVVRGIQDYHMDTQRWQDIAYSWLGCPHGYLYRGRGLWIRTAANGTNKANDHYHAYCFLGSDTSRRDITPEARRTLILLIAWLDRQVLGSGIAVCPHSAFTSTSCPGDELRALIRASGWKCRY